MKNGTRKGKGKAFVHKSKKERVGRAWLLLSTNRTPRALLFPVPCLPTRACTRIEKEPLQSREFLSSKKGRWTPRVRTQLFQRWLENLAIKLKQDYSDLIINQRNVRNKLIFTLFDQKVSKNLSNLLSIYIF